MTPIIKIAAFLKRRVSKLKYCNRKNLLLWLCWNDYNSSLAWLEENGKIVAAGMARPLKKSGDRVDRYCFDEDGEFLYSDYCASDSKHGFAHIVNCMRARFPKAKTFSFVNGHNGIYKEVNMNRFSSIAERMGN